MPDTYTSQFSGEEIDSAVRAAQMISGASTPAELRKKLEIRGDTIPVSATDPTPISEALTASGGGVNPNLLDNWYFGRPVNQRGKTEYTGEWKYTIDRWEISEGTLTVNDGSISNGSGYVFQAFPDEFSALLKEKLVTLSFLYADGSLESASATIPSAWGSWGEIINHQSIRLVGINNGNRLWVTNTIHTPILAAKLELGDTQTLAHKENGVWVLNEIPDFGEQLRRCQRYHREIERSNYGTFAFGMSTSDTEIDFLIPLNPPMRVAPSVSFEGNFATNGVSFTSISSLGVVKSYPDGIMLRATGSGFVRGEERTLQTSSEATSKIIISADI